MLRRIDGWAVVCVAQQMVGLIQAHLIAAFGRCCCRLKTLASLDQTTIQRTLLCLNDNIELDTNSSLRQLNVVRLTAKLLSIDQTSADRKEIEVAISFIGDFFQSYFRKFIAKMIANNTWEVNLILCFPSWSRDSLTPCLARSLGRTAYF